MNLTSFDFDGQLLVVKKGFAISAVFVIIGLLAVFAAVILVAQGTGFLPRAQSYGNLNLSVEAKNVDGKAQISASWKQIPGAEYRYGLYKGSEAVGQAIIPLKTTTSTSFTSEKLDLTDGKYTFIVIAGRAGGGFKSSGIKFNGKTVNFPHIDQGPDGYFGLPRNLHGTGINDNVRSIVGFGVDTKTFEWKAKTAGTPPTVEDNLFCSMFSFVEPELTGNVQTTTATPGESLPVHYVVNNSTGQNLIGVKNVLRFSGDAKFEVKSHDTFCATTSDTRVACTFDLATGALAEGSVAIQISPKAVVGSKLIVKNNLTSGALKGRDCLDATLTVAP